MNNKYYSDFEELVKEAAIKDCRACGEHFTGPTRLCQGCRLVYGDDDKKSVPPKKTMQPPTPAQLERINELKDHPEFQEHLDWLLTAIEKGMLNTRGQAGILINEMKKKCAGQKKETEPVMFPDNSGSMG